MIIWCNSCNHLLWLVADSKIWPLFASYLARELPCSSNMDPGTSTSTLVQHFWYKIAKPELVFSGAPKHACQSIQHADLNSCLWQTKQQCQGEQSQRPTECFPGWLETISVIIRSKISIDFVHLLFYLFSTDLIIFTCFTSMNYVGAMNLS